MSPMKVHDQFARPLWDHHEPAVNTGFDLKSFIRPESGPRSTLASSDYQHKESHDQPGGTRWNPTQEQIGILEMLYRSGMRTPNAHQIDQITAQLAKYGKIEGKNVFYWFQNHKARERQKQKRKRLGLTHTPPTPTTTTTTTALQLSPPASGVREELSDCALYKRKCKSWPAFEQCLEVNEEEAENRTLKLFPLHPEGRYC